MSDQRRMPSQAKISKAVMLEKLKHDYRVQILDSEGKIVFEDDARLRRYQTGSWGWHTAGKFRVEGQSDVRVQVNIGLTIIGSKEWEVWPNGEPR